MAEQTVKIGVEYDIRGIDATIRSSQRLLYFMNSIRLTIVDFQRVMEKPTIENVFWMSIQLTTVWTNLIRLIRQANMMSAGGNALNALGGYGGGGGGGGGFGRMLGGMGIGRSTAKSNALMSKLSKSGMMASGMNAPGLIDTLMAVMAIPGVAPFVGAAIVIGGAALYDINQRNMHNNWLTKQRETAKSQGLEY